LNFGVAPVPTNLPNLVIKYHPSGPCQGRRPGWIGPPEPGVNGQSGPPPSERCPADRGWPPEAARSNKVLLGAGGGLTETGPGRSGPDRPLSWRLAGHLKAGPRLSQRILNQWVDDWAERPAES